MTHKDNTYQHPFGAIDAITRLNLQNELKKLHSGLGKTFLLVTHDINEAFRLGTRVMIMNEGKLLQFDTPKNIVQNPADSFVETLIRSAREQEQFWEAVPCQTICPATRRRFGRRWLSTSGWCW